MDDIKAHKRNTTHKVSGITLGLLLIFVLSGCSHVPQTLDIQTTKEPPKNKAVVVTFKATPPPTAAIVCQESSAVENIRAITEFEAPDVIGNYGSNIENGGQTIFSNSYVYYIEDGLYRFETYNEESTKILDMTNIAYLNDVEDAIYFVTTDNYQVHRYHKDTAEVEALSIHGAYSLLVFGEYLYYQYAIGEYADMHMYRAHLDGSAVTDMGFSAANFCPDDIYIYFSNLDDNGHLYKYDITTGEIIKVKSDAVTQINVVEDRIYYIDQSDNQHIVRINKTGAGREVIIDEPCVSLNHMKDNLVFTRRDADALEIYNISDHSLKTLLSYPDINGISVADDWIFFEIPMLLESCSGLFRVQSQSGKVIPPLPEISLVKIMGYNADKKTITVDAVEYLTGDDAIKGYAAEKGVSESRAQRRLQEAKVNYFVRNRNPKEETYKLENFAAIKLYTHENGMVELSGYAATVDEFFILLESDPTTLDRILLDIITMGDDLISVEEYPLS